MFKRLFCAVAAAAALLGWVAAPAHAWKPTMHVYLAELALQDALDDGRVSIYRVDYQQGKVLTKVGDYAVDPELLTALRRFPAYYRAGVFGPDAYPDILTGQQVIHPETTPQGTDAWLQHIWQASISPALTGDKRLKVRAWTAGYLTHGGGDMFAHTYINHYAGGDFALGTNALRHIVHEGYIGKRCPDPISWDARIDGIEDFIYSTLIDARPGSNLERLLNVTEARTSVPAMFSKMRNDLVRDINAYYRMSTWDQIGYSITHPLWITYKEHWVEDIEVGLKQWPRVSHEIAKAMFFKPGGGDIEEAKRIAQRYVTDHLLSMAGAPDFVGATIGLVEAVKQALIPQFLIDAIEALKTAMIDALLKKAFGMTSQQIKDFFKSPEISFDLIMSRASGNEKAITLNYCNKTELKLNDAGYSNPAERFRPENFGPAYNTMVISKLILVQRSEISRLLADLGRPTPLATSFINSMLGFNKKFDGSLQWTANSSKLLYVNAGVYNQIFMAQPGEPGYVVPVPLNLITTEAKINFSLLPKVNKLNKFKISVFDPNSGRSIPAKITIAYPVEPVARASYRSGDEITHEFRSRSRIQRVIVGKDNLEEKKKKGLLDKDPSEVIDYPIITVVADGYSDVRFVYNPKTEQWDKLVGPATAPEKSAP